MNILVAKNGSQLGPFTEADIRTKLASGEFAPTDYGWKEGMAAWTPLSQMFADAPAQPPFAAPTPYLPPQGQSASSPYQPQPQGQPYTPQPYNAPQGQYSAPQTYNSPYPSPYQPGAVQQWGAFAYAGFWRRLLAYLIDVVILYVPMMILAGVLATVFGNRSSNDDNTVAGIAILLFYLVYLCGVVFYFSYLESSARQATFGKMALGIKVTDLYGNRISFGRGVGRFFGRFLSSLFFGVGYLMAAFTERKQALHDMVASTLVVKR